LLVVDEEEDVDDAATVGGGCLGVLDV